MRPNRARILGGWPSYEARDRAEAERDHQIRARWPSGGLPLAEDRCWRPFVPARLRDRGLCAGTWGRWRWWTIAAPGLWGRLVPTEKTAYRHARGWLSVSYTVGVLRLEGLPQGSDLPLRWCLIVFDRIALWVTKPHARC